MVTKEEIREGLKQRLQAYAREFHPPDAESYAMSEILLTYLHSQGVVIEVYRELPYINCGSQKGKNEAQLDMRDRMLKSGFVAVGPLI